MNVSIATRCIVFVLKIESMPVEYKVRLLINMYQCFLDRVNRESHNSGLSEVSPGNLCRAGE